MDAEVFLDMANHVAKLKMYPYFDLAHAVICCLAIKEDMGSGRISISLFSGVQCYDHYVFPAIVANFLLKNWRFS
jgi:hypothetical protein